MKMSRILRFFRGFGIAGIIGFMISSILIYLYLCVSLYWPFITYLTVRGISGSVAIVLYVFAFLILIFPIVSIAAGTIIGFLIGLMGGLIWSAKR